MDPATIAMGGFQNLMAPIEMAYGDARTRRQRQWAIEDRDFMLDYNLPKNQMARIREAGLPAAAMLGGGVSSQAEMPRSAQEVNPETGTLSNPFQEGMLLQQQAKQQEYLESQIATQEALAAKTWKEALIADSQARIATATADFELAEDSPAGKYMEGPQSNLIRKIQRERVLQQTNNDLAKWNMMRAKNSLELEQLEAKVRSDLLEDGTIAQITRQQMEQFYLQNDMLKQAVRRGKVMDTLIIQLEQSGGRMTVGEAFSHALFQGAFGGLGQITNMLQR